MASTNHHSSVQPKPSSAPPNKRRFLPIIRRLVRWIIHHFAEPCLSFICVYVGVLGTAILPRTLLPFPIQLPTNSFQITLIAALPVALIVWRKRAYVEWCATAHTSLGERMLTAISTGIVWGFNR